MPENFADALHLAVALGKTTPLAEYLESHALTEDERCDLAGLIRSLDRRSRGRPHRPEPNKMHTRDDPNVPVSAERNAALLVARWQIRWRQQHGRQRVPHVETKKMITEAIKAAAENFGISERKISADNMRRLLKQGYLVKLARR